MFNNNEIIVRGEITSPFIYSHTSRKTGEKYFKIYVETFRLSGVVDVVPVVISEYSIDVSENFAGLSCCVCGRVNTHNTDRPDGRKGLDVYVLADAMNLLDYSIGDTDNVNLTGYICKPPQFRETPLGRKICEIMLAVNRNYVVTDYIPCICWGRTAVFASKLKVGTCISVKGRFQSREYVKNISETEHEFKRAYEISAFCVEVKNDRKKS